MNRRSASLLIPLLAVFALFYPASNREGSLRSEQTTRSAPDNTPKAKTTAEHEWDRGRTAVRRFLSQKKLAAPESKIEDPLHLRANTTLHFMIVTVPDPIDSGLSQAFDRYVASIESAVQTHPYYLWSFDLPWKDCLAEKKSNKEASAPTQETNQGGSPQDDQSESTDSCRDRRYAKEPGYLLFNSPTYITKDEIESDAKGGTKKDDQKDAPKDAHEKGSIDLLLVYLVGETPTSGIQKRALKAALSEIGSYCGWRKDGKDPYTQEQGPQSPTCKDGKIDILAPSYSGSAQSLDIALSTWLDSEDKNKHVHYIRMVSGSATAISTETDFYYIQNIIKDRSAEFSFSSMELPDNVSNEKFCQYLKEHYSSTTKLKVALLSEGNTAYGQNAKKATEGADAENSPPTDRQKSENENKPAQNLPPRCWDDMEMDILPFPLHISQLRAASERLREAEEASNPQPQISSKALPLSQALEDVRTQRDIPPFSPANAVANEQILGNLLATISREGYRFVGITASDTRDTIFLAQEVHEHSPQAVLFTTGAELLFLHPEINPSLRGMLIVTSYPLINSNQLWSQPAHFGVRLQFPDDGSEGIYNATLALLADKNSKNNDGNIMEFGPPFINEATKACALYHDCGPEDKPDNPRFSSDPNKCDSSKVLRPAVWIMVVGKNRLWPVKADDVTCDQDVSKYTKSVEGRHVTPHGKKTWLQGMYRQGILIFIVGFAVFCCLFSLPLIQRARTSEYGAIAGLRKLLQWEWLDALLAKTVTLNIIAGQRYVYSLLPAVWRFS